MVTLIFFIVVIILFYYCRFYLFCTTISSKLHQHPISSRLTLSNTIVRSCFNHAIVDVNSCIGAKFAFLRSLGVVIFKHKLCEAIQQVPLSKITVEQQADTENLRNLMFVRSKQSFSEGFDDTDIDCMIQYITGH